jgi:hypothetical protein
MYFYFVLSYLYFEHISMFVLFSHFISCGENGDMIRVYDGSDKSAKLLHTFCDNTHNQETFESSGQYMYIEFHSDRHYEAQGFAADYEFIDTREGGSPVPSDSMYTQLFLKHYFLKSQHKLTLLLSVILSSNFSFIL